MTRSFNPRWSLPPGPPLPAAMYEEVAVRVAAWPGTAWEMPAEFVRRAIVDALSQSVLRSVRHELRRPYRSATRASWRQWQDEFVACGTVSSERVALAGIAACRMLHRRPDRRRSVRLILNDKAREWAAAANALLAQR